MLLAQRESWIRELLEYARAAHGAAGAQPGAYAAVLAERLTGGGGGGAPAVFPR